MSVSDSRDIHPHSDVMTVSQDKLSKVPTMSYAKAAQKEICPGREQAIVFDSIDDVPIKEYAIAVANKIGPQNIIAISRITQKRVCLYLSSKDLANKLIDTHRSVKVNNKLLEIRPLIAKTKRVIISNVQPVIPNIVLENKFAELNISLKSQITTLRAGLDEVGFSHIQSFRRQVHIDPEDLQKIPPATLIVHENIKHWVYISGEKLTCFRCKNEGHLAKYCQNQELNNSQTNTTDIAEQSILDFTQVSTISDISSSTCTQQNKNIIENTAENNLVTEFGNTNTTSSFIRSAEPEQDGGTFKRPYCSSTSSANTSNDKNYKPNDIDTIVVKPRRTRKEAKPATKKIKTQEVLNKDIEPALLHFTENNIDPHISFEKLSAFLSETYGNSNPLDIALKYTNRITEFVEFLKEVCKHIEKKNIIARIKRIIKKIDDPKATISSSDEITSSEEYE